MIYCVVPQELAPELYDKLASYYDGDPNVKVIVDRRRDPERRGKGPSTDPHEKERRSRMRIPGEFLPTDAPD